MISYLSVDVTGYTGKKWTNSEILRHNFTLRVSTGVFESRTLSSIYIYIYIIKSWCYCIGNYRHYRQAFGYVAPN